MSTYLLDTHTLIWLLLTPNKVPSHARELLADPRNTRLVSAVTAMEITLKHRLGKMPEADALVRSWAKGLTDVMATETPLTVRQGFMAGALDWNHKDPFDRMLVATAIDLDVPLVSGDAMMPSAPGLNLLWQ